MESYDVIVIGTGGVGSAATRHLARRGARVLGLERFQPPHDRGSSHGHSRVIRQAYFEHPDYVPLLRESYRLWHELEERSGQQLFHQVGVVQVGPANGVVVPGVLRAAQEHGLAVEELSAENVCTRWPGMVAEAPLVAAFEQEAGYLLVEDCVRGHLELARVEGADLRYDVEVLEWSADDEGVRVRTSEGDFSAAKLVITAGAWTTQLLIDLGVPFEVRRKSLFWFATDDRRYEVDAGFPVFLFELPDCQIYGFPEIDARGVKVAAHTGGEVVDDPLAVDRSIYPAEQQELAKFLAQHLPGVGSQVTDHAVCLYTMSPDESFVVGRHPQHPNVAFAAGLSGHGFKFTAVLGKIMADLALDGATPLPIEFLSVNRFG